MMGTWAVRSIQVAMATTWEGSPQEWELCPGSHSSQPVLGFSLLTLPPYSFPPYSSTSFPSLLSSLSLL